MTTQEVRERYQNFVNQINELEKKLDKPDLTFEEIRDYAAQSMSFLYHVIYFRKFEESRVLFKEHSGLVGQLYDLISPLRKRIESMFAEAEFVASSGEAT